MRFELKEEESKNPSADDKDNVSQRSHDPEQICVFGLSFYLFDVSCSPLSFLSFSFFSSLFFFLFSSQANRLHLLHVYIPWHDTHLRISVSLYSLRYPNDSVPDLVTYTQKDENGDLGVPSSPTAAPALLLARTEIGKADSLHTLIPNGVYVLRLEFALAETSTSSSHSSPYTWEDLNCVGFTIEFALAQLVHSHFEDTLGKSEEREMERQQDPTADADVAAHEMERPTASKSEDDDDENELCSLFFCVSVVFVLCFLPLQLS